MCHDVCISSSLSLESGTKIKYRRNAKTKHPIITGIKRLQARSLDSGGRIELGKTILYTAYGPEDRFQSGKQARHV